MTLTLADANPPVRETAATVEALADTSHLLLLAIPEVPHFDGLADREGRVIDAAAVLEAQRARDPEGASSAVKWAAHCAKSKQHEATARGSARQVPLAGCRQ